MTQPFQLAACAEMLWQDKPIAWRAARLTEMGFGVGLWNWPDHDIAKLEAVGANYTIMNGYLQGRLADDEGAEILLASAKETVQVGKRLGVDRLNLHGTGLGEGGIPIWQHELETGDMWLKARDSLMRICDLAEAEGVVFTLENLNLLDHPGCPFGSTADVLALVSAIDLPQLRINLDLYHTQIGEGDLIRWCEKCLPWIGEVQVADNPGRFEPGSGEINYTAVARALAEMGYRGPIGMEAFAKTDSEAALEAFRKAFTL
ncbi:Hydroxypyruvate isomerase [Pelagimonas phthalicica]|uniref:Hydroxypyruvate isomerase n=1 Tax=Pelagimonas phthalicica TaxID=1037362 RepID=A0A238JDN3_9RHOB|nr:TIM barrel protein [Pelagimonas phthalicica]TDS93523.1 hydroxypyruvate isomerase [Pelagimonas phthalicica]SMX27956.1 Hydroxypyruvate isomerase [Pelagimonas phthalicica]